MSTRLRIAAVTVGVHMVADDGDTLTPVQTEPVTIAGSDWPRVVDIVADAVAQLQAKYEPPVTLP